MQWDRPYHMAMIVMCSEARSKDGSCQGMRGGLSMAAQNHCRYSAGTMPSRKFQRLLGQNFSSRKSKENSVEEVKEIKV